MTAKQMLMLAGILGALGVVVGAMGAHALPGYLQRAQLAESEITKRTEQLQTGVDYHLVHVLALVGLGLLQAQRATMWGTWTSLFWLAGLLLFSFALYALAVTGNRFFAHCAPFGGVCYIVGWCTFAVAAAKSVSP